ncbi:MAG: chemotaxis protein CheA [bacterium]|nr:chemotaxis protein CheA [bacterium]
MPIDISRFHESFFDEVAEHLATIERIALALDADPHADAETYDELFRAAHSIKGASGIFGFAEMAEATHALEALLDALRNGAIEPTSDVIAAILEAHDELRALLAAYRSHEPANADALHHLRVRLEATRTGANARAPVRERRLIVRVRTARRDHERAATLASIRDALGAIARVEEIADDGETWRASVVGAHAAERLREILLFATDDHDRVDVEEAAEAAPEPKPLDASAFGFFDDDETAATTAPPTEHRSTAPTARARGENAEGSSIRVDVKKVDQLIDLVGEMLIAQAALQSSLAELDEVRHQELLSAAERLSRYTRDVREAVMGVRMLPIGSIFARFHRLVRDTARDLGKSVTLQTGGDDTELDKGLLESVIDPLTHLVRNAIDHGIESPDERIAAGKPAAGTIALRAYERSGNVYIEIADDGRGIDRDRVMARARDAGIALSDDPSDDEIFGCIFLPGFSTAASVTELSGRGVGMDVVRRNLAAIGGHVDVESAAGAGTTIRLRLPLTLAILDGLSVRVGDETMILPIASVRESIVLSASDVHVAADRPFIAYRDTTLPLIFMSDDARTSDGEHVALVVEHDRLAGGLVVDAIEGQHQVVIKSLEANFRRVEGYSGATVLGNGRVALILDVNAILTSGSFGHEAVPKAS